ncbi:MAG: AarF/ABC1/UbiB kinase family protein [Deltaproteobacteria bacterium]|jgi:predicted unusual protein kinase regulating ubiquinone biosynthesis (AarF/ABC1/UbiB family)|nr:AarF/ABC1/UbiB kinase family protein [Deltaproteobacteria bacterium]
MNLFVRLVRAQLTFGVIFLSYMVQLGLLKVFRRWEVDPETGREDAAIPGWLERRQARVDEKNSRRLLADILKLRGVYIKLGQVLSIMGGFLPSVYIKKLETLQDAVPPHSFDEIEQAFVESLGARPEAFFESIERDPVAAASLGQVHVAYMEGGRKVAVKVLYPGIRDVVRIDLKVIKLMVRVYKWFVPVQNIEAVHESLVDLLRRETDYLHEADCMRRMAANFAGDDHILFPEVIEQVTTKDVLTMTFMEGIKITRLDEIRRCGVNLDKLGERLVRSFYKQVFVHRFFHADPHPGNFLVQPIEGTDDANLVVLDFGAISEVDENTVFGMVDVLRGFFEQNDELVLRGIEDIGFVAEGGDRALLEQTVKTYFQKLLKLESYSPSVLMKSSSKELEALADPEVERRELRSLMRSVHYPDGWFYVERASVMMFWLAGQIAPDLNQFEVGFPYVLPLLSQRLSKSRPSQPPEPPSPRESVAGGG